MKLKYILIVASLVVAMTGVGIWASLRTNNDLADHTTIEVNGNTTKTLQAEITNFYPGMKSSYVIELSGKGAEDYTVSVTFHDSDQGGLEEFIVVTVVTENARVEMPLKEALKGEVIPLGKNAQKITVEYSMSKEIGNEAQGKGVRFLLDVSASQQSEK